tara:strand:+ start:52541 stop:52861 length:321 start_codon:yes stop_codon:yes gene_type:complete
MAHRLAPADRFGILSKLTNYGHVGKCLFHEILQNLECFRSIRLRRSSTSVFKLDIIRKQFCRNLQTLFARRAGRLAGAELERFGTLCSGAVMIVAKISCDFTIQIL